MVKNIEIPNNEVKEKSPEELLAHYAKSCEGKVVFSTSLSAEDQVITHMIAENGLNIEIFTIDTGRLPCETYELIKRTENRYKVKIKVYFPGHEKVEEMVNSLGINLFYESPEQRKMCCSVRKVEPLKRALSEKEVWVTGLRKEQSVTRKDLKPVDFDEGYHLIKLNPLLDWDSEMVWEYIETNRVPYNRLYDEGYLSIGCAPCTRAVKVGEDIRAGRWWWESPEHKECGLHIKKG